MKITYGSSDPLASYHKGFKSRNPLLNIKDQSVQTNLTKLFNQWVGSIINKFTSNWKG